MMGLGKCVFLSNMPILSYVKLQGGNSSFLIEYKQNPKQKYERIVFQLPFFTARKIGQCFGCF